MTTQVAPIKQDMSVMIAGAGEHGDAFQANAPLPAGVTLVSSEQKPPDDIKTDAVDVTADGEVVAPNIGMPPETAVAPEVKPEAKETETPATAEVAETVEEDAIDKYIKEASTPSTPVVLTDDAKAAVKQVLGTDDLQAIAQERLADKEIIAQSTEKVKQAERLLENIKGMPYELAEAMTAVAEGRPFKGMLEQLSRGVTLSKEAKDIDQDTLVEAYFPGKFTAEQKQAIKDGDEMLTGAWVQFADLAAQRHDGTRGEKIAAMQAREQARVALDEKSKAADIAAVAHLKTDKATAHLVDGPLIKKFLSGELENELLYNPDGTRKPESFALLVRGMKHSEVLARMQKGALADGKLAGEMKAHSALATTPPAGNAQRTIAPPKKTDDPLTKNLVDGQALISQLTTM